MKKLVKRSDVMQETLEAYCSCSCSCYGTCSCSTGQTNNSAALFQARYTQFYMDFVAIVWCKNIAMQRKMGMTICFGHIVMPV